MKKRKLNRFFIATLIAGIGVPTYLDATSQSKRVSYSEYSTQEVDIEKELELVDGVSKKITKGNFKNNSDEDEFSNGDIYDEFYKDSWNTSVVHPRINEKLPECVDIDCSNFTFPTLGYVTSKYGKRRRRMHYGIDLKVQVGDPIVAAFAGRVRIAKYAGGYGNVVVLRHPNGLETIYGHLSKILVKVNQEVNAGECIALGGNTGRSTGSHLHFELRFMGKPINPSEICDFTNSKLLNKTYVFHPNKVIYSPNKRNTLLARAKTNKSTSVTRSKSTSRSKSVREKYVARRSFHTVSRGDTLSSIARRYRTTVSKLLALNGGIRKNGKLSIGQKIRYM